MKRHVPKLMLVLAVAALVVAIITPLMRNLAPFAVKPGYADQSAFSYNLGAAPESLMPKNPLQPTVLSAPLDYNIFMVRKVVVRKPYQPIDLTIPPLEREPIDYFVMSFLPPPPPPPKIGGDREWLNIPPGSEWATLTTTGMTTYRGDLLNDKEDPIEFRVREQNGRPPARPFVLRLPKSELAKPITPAVDIKKEFGAVLATSKKDPMQAADVLREGLDRYPDLLRDEVVKQLQSGVMGASPEGVRGLLAVVIHPALRDVTGADKLQLYAEQAEKNLADKTDLVSLKIRGYLLIQVNRFEEARKVLAVAQQQAPNDTSVLQLLAFAQLKTLRLSEAKQNYDQLNLLSIGPKDPTATIGKAMAEARMVDFDAAAATVASIQVPTEDFVNRSYKALAGVEIAIAQGKLDDAELALTKDIKDDATTSRREMLLGIIAHKKEDLPGALAHFTAAVDPKLTKIEPWAWFLHGYESEKQSPDTAQKSFAQAEKLAPFEPLIKLKLGDMAANRNDIAAAASYYEQAVNLDPTDHRAWKRWIQALPADKKIGTVNTWLELLKADDAPAAVRLQAVAVRSVYMLSQGQDTAAATTAEGVIAEQPDNVTALVTLAVLADRGKQEARLKTYLETILARTQSEALNAWALKSLNQIYLQAEEHLDYFNLRTENADQLKWGKTYGSRSGIVRDYSTSGLTISGTPPDAKNELMKFGFRVPGKDFIRVRLTVTIVGGAKEAGAWVGRDSTTSGLFNIPTLEVGVSDSLLKTLLYRNKDSAWQTIDFPEIAGFRGAQANYDGIPLTYAIEMTDPIKGIFKVNINGIDAGSTAPLEAEAKMGQLAMSVGGFVRGSSGIPVKVRFENLLVVSRATKTDVEIKPDAGLVRDP